MGFSPVEASKDITKKYLRYLNTAFHIGKPYDKEFASLVSDSYALAKGPYLDVTDTFKTGKSPRQLITDGVLPQSFCKVNMKIDRPLYLHQENALRRVALKGRNIVVSTGTGSGKTESFLLPILRELINEYESGTLSPGVRALLVYPMNALANDQVERLRVILSGFPEITFGVYTGQTQKKRDKALAEYKKLNENKEPIVNELISREEMIDSPPHIFITNYAMLEYLMVRPSENVFFEGKYSHSWKFIVFDEAHVYSGSTGIEVSMLFRRLRAKLPESADIRYILTSATLGDKEDDDKVAEFAKNLCNAPFYAEDVIRADRVTLYPDSCLDTLDVGFYEKAAKVITEFSDEDALQELSIETKDPIDEALYEIVIADENYWHIRDLLTTPATVSYIAQEMRWSVEQVAAFVTVASLCQKDGVRLFDARYHMFLRATDSAFVTLAPDNRILLERQNFRFNPQDEEKYKVFEVATCIYCDAVYLVGKIDDHRLEQFGGMDDLEEKEIFLLSDTVNDTDDDHTFAKEGISADEYRICPYCGHLHRPGSKTVCEHKGKNEVTVFRLKLTASHRLTKCPKCENSHGRGVLRQLYSGQEAATSVIGTALFESLPSYRIEKVSAAQELANNDFDSFDDFGEENDFGQETTPAVNEELAKQFIAFSDSRQAAAFYASFLKTTYTNILYKRLMIEALKKVNSSRCGALEFLDRLQNEFEKYGIGKTAFADTGYSQNKESWKAILRELVDSNGNTSLANLGLLSIGVDVSGSFKRFFIDSKEFSDMCAVLISSMLQDAAIYYDANLNDNDKDFFTHNRVEYAYTLSDSAGKYVNSFIPSRKALSNKRVDYVRRVLESKSQAGLPIDIPNDDRIAQFLENLWNKVLINQGIVKYDKTGYRVSFDKIKLGKGDQWYICDKCHRLTSHNIGNVCPSYKCTGTLSPVNLEELFENNHYYRIYNDLDIRNMTVVEHTAQLDRETAYKYQNEFKQKKIDILSCSTTFEMGVDVGSLETVFMRNMPPSPSNYAQRAGRAGRSKQSAAFALTFCNKASHDFSYYADPISMIKGKINPPIYALNNDRIGIRHLYASAFGFFWRLFPKYFNNVQKFADGDESGDCGYRELCNYLLSYPSNLKEYLLRFLPEELCDKYGVESFEWVEDLIGEEGRLTRAIDTYHEEIALLNEQKEYLNRENKYNGMIIQRLRAYTEENVLAFMSRKNILPKYGFPVDTVDLTVTKEHSGLQLSRDLSIAISEYAPGSQIVANGDLITSRYIKKVPRIGWKMYSYVRCPSCNSLNMKLYIEDQILESCAQCGAQFGETRDTKTNVFLIPELGFIAESKVKAPGLQKPARTYSGEMSYVGFKEISEANEFYVANAKVVVRSSHNDEMAVLNRNAFYVCEQCGYAELDELGVFATKKSFHQNSGGYKCTNDLLKKYSLGYVFKTDVVIIDFPDHIIDNWNHGLSILYAFLRGTCLQLNIEESDISGCLQMFNGSYSLVIFDNTPGGSGHAKRLDNAKTLEAVLRRTLSIVSECTCGGEEGDSSCYFCLRNYRNQRYHDKLKRNYVVEFLKNLL